MNVSELIDLLPARVGASNRGPDGPFTGFNIRPWKVQAPGRFVVIMDKSWGEMAHKRGWMTDASLATRVQHARDQGYGGVICSTALASDPALDGMQVLSAEDSAALSYAIMEASRARRGQRRITAITGSMGKSSTKAMMVHAMRSVVKKSEIYSPPGLQNISADVMSHLSKSGNRRHTVLEVASGAIRSFTNRGAAVSPDVAIVTGIAEAHIEAMGDLEGVATRKGQLFLSPPAGGTAVINLDAPHSDLLIRTAVESGCQLVTYGESPKATIRLHDYNTETGQVTAAIGDERVMYRVGARGRHMALNSLAVLATLRAYRIESWRDAIQSLETFQALPGRGQTTQVEIRPGVETTLIDDAYNANPASVRAALARLAATPISDGNQRIAVLGDMRELGPESSALHAALAEDPLMATIDTLHLFGPEMAALREQIVSSDQATHWTDVAALQSKLQEQTRPGDVLLIKSSHGTGLHELVTALKSRPTQ